MNNNRFYLAVMFSFFLLQSVGISKDENNYPIILVHGFMGWGRDEMAGYRYWGGKFDIEEYLTENGFEVYTTSIGPVSSNWDRAIELFYQIKGGQVDYGKAHSDKFELLKNPVLKNSQDFIQNGIPITRYI